MHTTPEIERINFAIGELSGLLPSYLTEKSDERGPYFRGLLEQARDSLVAIRELQAIGYVWPVHCRWTMEALASATVLAEDQAMVANFKRSSARTFFIVLDVSEAKRMATLDRMAPADAPTVTTALETFEKMAGTEPGLLYKYYRLLCEYAHLEFYRTSAYPNFGFEAPDDPEFSKKMFLWLASACAMSLPALIHCPPSCGFPDKEFEKAMDLTKKAWSKEDMPTTMAKA